MIQKRSGAVLMECTHEEDKTDKQELEDTIFLPYLSTPIKNIKRRRRRRRRKRKKKERKKENNNNRKQKEKRRSSQP